MHAPVFNSGWHGRQHRRRSRLGAYRLRSTYAEKARALGAKLAPSTLESALKGAVDSVNELAAMGPRR